MHTQKELEKIETLEEIKEILLTATFPCSRDDILKCAKDAHAPRRIMNILKILPERPEKFKNINEIVESISNKLDLEQ